MPSSANSPALRRHSLNSAAGAQARFRVGVQDLEKAIGRGLLPEFTKLTNTAADWLNSEQNQKKVQAEVASSARNLQQAFEGILSVVRPLATAAKETSDALGGLKNTLQLLTAFFVASRIVKYAAAIRGVGVAAGASAGEVGGLGAALGALPATVAIVIGVEIVLHKKGINNFVEGLISHLPEGPGKQLLTTKSVNIPLNASISDLEKTRKQVASLRGENDLLVKVLDAAIKRQKALLTGQGSAGSDVLKGRGSTVGATSAKNLFDPITKAIDASIRNAETAMKRGKTKAIKVFQQTMDELARAMTIADATPSLRDNLKLLKRELQLVDDEIKVEGKTKDLLDQRAQITADITTTQREITQNQQKSAKEATKQAKATKTSNEAAQRNAKQFKTLGLTATGEQITPSVAALSRRLTSVKGAVKGTVLDTSKTRTELARIAKVLSGAFGKVGKDVRSAILQMLNDISNALGGTNDKVGPLTKTTALNTKKLVAGLGLTPEQERQLRSRASSFNSAGRALASPTGQRDLGRDLTRDRGQPFVVESTVNVEIDGKKVATVVTKNQQRARRRNPRQKRGPNRTTGGV